MAEEAYIENDCMTVRELKAIVATLRDEDDVGEEFEVWMMTGDGVTSPVVGASRLNRGDILFGCRQWPVSATRWFDREAPANV